MLFLHKPKQVLVLVQSSVQLALCQYNIASGVTGGGQRGKLPTWQAECKNGLPVNLHFSLSILLVFSRLLFFCVFRIIFGDSRFLLSHSHPDSPSILKFFSECWLVDTVQLPVATFIYCKIITLVQTFS